MDRDAVYRRAAAYAQRRADQALNADDREGWLCIAEGWLALLRKGPVTPHERFDALAKRLGTRQKVSDELH